jgi:hypothetical protein
VHAKSESTIAAIYIGQIRNSTMINSGRCVEESIISQGTQIKILKKAGFIVIVNRKKYSRHSTQRKS